jgi:large-conductance mechanosensitive channel
MNETGLSSGDKVIALAALVQNVSFISGGLITAYIYWVAKHRYISSCIAFIIGACVGYIIGMIVGRIIFPASGGNVVVVKTGIGSILHTIKAGLSGSLITSAVLLPLIAFIVKTSITQVLPMTIIMSIGTGLLFACLASLL